MPNRTLEKELERHFSCITSRLSTFCILVLGVMRQHTTNLSKLAADGPAGMKPESLYRRFQHFFSRFAFPFDDLGKMVLNKVPEPKEGWVLAMDRTNWKYGRAHINLLVVVLLINKVGVPVLWSALPAKTKRGNSNTKHRISLMERVLKLVPATAIRALVMDREFSGERWLQWLDDQNVGYVLRIKKNTLIDGKKATSYVSKTTLKKRKKRSVWKRSLFFTGQAIQGKNTRDTHLFLVSNRFSGKTALQLYKSRWGIEQVFSHFKKRGFDLETTHMSEGKKVEVLFAVLTVAFLFSYGWGCELKSSTCLNAQQKRKSIFRLGADYLLRCLNREAQFAEHLDEWLEWLSGRKYQSIFVV